MDTNLNCSGFSSIKLDDIDNIFNTFTCPVSYDVMDKAVILMPCAHRVQQAVAEKLYGPMLNKQLDEKKPCPVCKTQVVKYQIDYSIRSIAEKLPKILSEVRSLIKQSPKKSIVEVEQPIYPSTSVKFTISHLLAGGMVHEMVLEAPKGSFIWDAHIYKWPRLKNYHLTITFLDMTLK